MTYCAIFPFLTHIAVPPPPQILKHFIASRSKTHHSEKNCDFEYTTKSLIRKKLRLAFFIHRYLFKFPYILTYIYILTFTGILRFSAAASGSELVEALLCM